MHGQRNTSHTGNACQSYCTDCVAISWSVIFLNNAGKSLTCTFCIRQNLVLVDSALLVGCLKHMNILPQCPCQSSCPYVLATQCGLQIYMQALQNHTHRHESSPEMTVVSICHRCQSVVKGVVSFLNDQMNSDNHALQIAGQDIIHQLSTIVVSYTQISLTSIHTMASQLLNTDKGCEMAEHVTVA